jgi:hypothetical protein
VTAVISIVENCRRLSLPVPNPTTALSTSTTSFESSTDYDPAPKLNEITKPMLTINFADDLDQSSRTPALTCNTGSTEDRLLS